MVLVAFGSVVMPSVEVGSGPVKVVLVFISGGTGGFVPVGRATDELEEMTTVTPGHRAPIPNPA